MTPTTPKEAMLRAAEIVEGMAWNGRSLPKEIAAEIRAEAEKMPDDNDWIGCDPFENGYDPRNVEKIYRDRVKEIMAERDALAARVRELEQARLDAIQAIPITMDVIIAVGKAILKYLPPDMPSKDLGELSYAAALGLKQALLAELDRAASTLKGASDA